MITRRNNKGSQVYIRKVYVWKLGPVPAWPGTAFSEPVSVQQYAGAFDSEEAASIWLQENPGDYIVVNGTAVHTEGP